VTERDGFGKNMVLGRLDKMAGAFEAALRESAEELKAEGFPEAVALSGKILQNGGTKQIDRV